jgi:hypothetical protein
MVIVQVKAKIFRNETLHVSKFKLLRERQSGNNKIAS